MKKSNLKREQTTELNAVGRSYYIFCLETAFSAVEQARMLVKGDPVDASHELPLIYQKLQEALDAS